jgi:hypothetical protein
VSRTLAAVSELHNSIRIELISTRQFTLTTKNSLMTSRKADGRVMLLVLDELFQIPFAGKAPIDVPLVVCRDLFRPLKLRIQ